MLNASHTCNVIIDIIIINNLYLILTYLQGFDELLWRQGDLQTADK